MKMKSKWTVVLFLSALVLCAGFFLSRGYLLNTAASRGNLTAVKFLVFLGTDVDGLSGPESERFPLISAIGDHHYAVARYLISKGASIHKRDRSLGSVFYCTVRFDWDEESEEEYLFLEYLLQLGADVNSGDLSGETPLMHSGTARMVDFLLSHGADINLKDLSGNSILHNRCDGRDLPLYLKAGADAKAINEMGETPIHYCLDRRSVGNDTTAMRNFRLMVEAGLDPRAKDNAGEMAISYAIKEGHDNMVALLQSLGGGVEMTPELAAARDKEAASMLYRRMHALPRTRACQVTLRHRNLLFENGDLVFGLKGEPVEALGSCPSGGFLHGVIYGNGKVFGEFMNLSAGMSGYGPIQSTQGPVTFKLEEGMKQAEAAWVVTEKPAASMRQALSQASAGLASKQGVRTGRRGN